MSQDHPEETGATLQDILARRRQRTLQRVILAVALLLAIAGAVWMLKCEESEPPPAPIERPTLPPPPRVAPAPPPPPAPKPIAPPAPPAPPPLPDLDASDPLVRESALELSQARKLNDWLSPQDLIRRLVAAVDNIGRGRSPREQLVSLVPSQKFQVRLEEDRAWVDPASWSRYDAVTSAFVALNPAATVALYRSLQPLFDEAYRDLGYPRGNFDDAIAAALDELLSTPVVVGDVAVSEQILSWEYTDPDLESLSSAQKLLLRTGPTNAPRIQRQLRALAAALGIPASELPGSRIHEARLE
jgi:hypothetical protein